METSTVKPKNCNFDSNEFYWKHLPGAFSRYSESLRKKNAFIMKDSRNLRSKPYNTVLMLFIWSVMYLMMLDFSRCAFQIAQKKIFYQPVLFAVPFI